MKYDLAKELADAGFTQGGEGKGILPPDQIVSRRGDRVYVPTLSELIEACGERFESVGKNRPFDNGWTAFTDGENDFVDAQGDTPERSRSPFVVGAAKEMKR